MMVSALFVFNFLYENAFVRENIAMFTLKEVWLFVAWVMTCCLNVKKNLFGASLSEPHT